MKTKLCKGCGITKPIDYFYKSQKHGVQHRCKQCQGSRRKKNYDYNLNLMQRYKTRVGCKVCGYKGHPAALVLDHRDRSTERNVSQNRSAVNYVWSTKRLKEEVRRCDVMCANCHNIKTFRENRCYDQEED